MTQLDPHEVEAYDAARAIIGIEADKLARAHALDVERVKKTLERTAVDYYGDPLPQPGRGKDTLANGLRFDPSLHEALEYLPAEEALAAFERHDLASLAKRASLIPYLSDLYTPFYTLEELSDLLASFAAYLEANEKGLVETGYPNTRFDKSLWLDAQLALLNPTKVPASAFEKPVEPSSPPDHDRRPLAPFEAAVYEKEGQLPRDAEGDLVYSYWWATEPGPFAWGADGLRSVEAEGCWESLQPVHLCGHDDAPHIGSISEDVARRVEHGRAELLRVKLDILRTCARHLRSREVASYWPAILDSLTTAFASEEMDFYLALDVSYTNHGVGRAIASSFGQLRNVPGWGGVTDLLSVVGHVEKELRVGTLSRTKSSVLSAVRGLGSIESYFQVIGHPGEARLGEALDAFWRLEEKERLIWDEFRQRVDDALDNAFDEEVVVHARVKQEHASEFRLLLQSFATWQETHLKVTGAFAPQGSPDWDSPGAGLRVRDKDRQQESVFRKEGDYWAIGYGGPVFRLKGTKGLQYIAHLLRNPEKDMYVLELVSIVERGGAPSADAVYGSMTEQQLAEHGLSVRRGGDAGESLDEHAAQEYKAILHRLQEQLDEAKEFGDIDRVADIEEEMQLIAQELTRGKGLGGRSRKAKSSAERARVNVTKLINAALKRIQGEDQALGQFLRNSITTGVFCSYRPDKPVNWVF